MLADMTLEQARDEREEGKREAFEVKARLSRCSEEFARGRCSTWAAAPACILTSKRMSKSLRAPQSSFQLSAEPLGRFAQRQQDRANVCHFHHDECIPTEPSLRGVGTTNSVEMEWSAKRLRTIERRCEGGNEERRRGGICSVSQVLDVAHLPSGKTCTRRVSF